MHTRKFVKANSNRFVLAYKILPLIYVVLEKPYTLGKVNFMNGLIFLVIVYGIYQEKEFDKCYDAFGRFRKILLFPFSPVLIFIF